MAYRILRLPAVKDKTGKSKAAIYREIAKGEFPSPIKLSERSSGWIESEIDSYIEEKIAATRGGVSI